jgi:hypothetical protein
MTQVPTKSLVVLTPTTTGLDTVVVDELVELLAESLAVTDVLPPLPPQAASNALKKKANKQLQGKMIWFIKFPLKTPRAHQTCVIPLAHEGAANNRN